MGTRNPNLNGTSERPRNHNSKSVQDGEEDLLGLVGQRGMRWFTGKTPLRCAGMDSKSGALRAIPMPNLATCTRQDVLDYFDNAWCLTEVLFGALQGKDAFHRQPYHQLRHPMIFYYGHPAVLYVNKFRVAGLLSQTVNDQFEQLFETGVDEMSWDDLSQSREDWPSVEAVHEFRTLVYRVIRSILELHPCLEERPITWDSQAWAIFMAIDHERIHLETSSVLIRELPVSCLSKPEYWAEYHPSSRRSSPAIPSEGRDYPRNPLIEVKGETVVLGKPEDYPSYGWDNEYGSKVIDVAPFKASKFKVTNGQFLAFVQGGGYHVTRYWSKQGWNWKSFRNVKCPTFWVHDGPQGLHQYKLRLQFDVVAMRWDWPVDVNYHEAQAYCAWKTEKDGETVWYRVITEAEHMLIRNVRDRVDSCLKVARKNPSSKSSRSAAMTPQQQLKEAKNSKSRHVVMSSSMPSIKEGERHSNDLMQGLDVAMDCSGTNVLEKYGMNLQLAYGSQSPVSEFPPSQKGFHDVMGNAWEWSEDHFSAFPGFRPHPFYDDFSSPCFAGLHQMIIGGSYISTGQLASKFARYEFRPHYFQHATFRLVQSVVDFAEYDMVKYGAHSPLLPYFETSCTDSAPPQVLGRPCCTRKNLSQFTLTKTQQAKATQGKVKDTQKNYQTDFLLAQYMALHFGPFEEVYRDFVGESGLLKDAIGFAQKCAAIVRRYGEKSGMPMTRALDLGCAVGGASFELAKVYDAVVGIDISHRFVESAELMKNAGSMIYESTLEGDITERLIARLDPDIDTSRVSFLQGDACSLPEGIGTFNAVLAANLLCRVPKPRQCLDQIQRVTKDGGIVVFTSPFTWLQDFTDQSEWLGGKVGTTGVQFRSAESLNKYLISIGFEILHEGTLPLIIRETQRKYQFIMSHLTVARKRNSSAPL